MNSDNGPRLLVGSDWVMTRSQMPMLNPFTGEEFARFPLGGFGREGVCYAMEEMTELKSLIIKRG
jgi:hypothetical protein